MNSAAGFEACQLLVGLEKTILTAGKKMVRLARFERTTACLEGRCSIQLSYRRTLINTRVLTLVQISH